MKGKKRAIIQIAGAVLGSVGGFLYYYFVGCVSGSCAITSNPVISTLYGAALGFLLTVILMPDANKKADPAQKN